MRLEDYFDFLAHEDIRIKGTRVGIETVLTAYLEGLSPEEIAAHYPALTLEKVYATITYYLHNRTEVEAYMEAWRQHGEQMWQEQQCGPSPMVSRLRELARKKRAEILAQS
ncbi:MAG: DUF433 domain-containing protein [Anaerolineae bacterium]